MAFMHTVLLDILHDIPWDQIFPILFVFLIAPLLAIVTYYQAVKARPTIAWLAIMVFENLGLGFAWSWLYGGGSGSGNKTEGKTSKRKHVRRADQVAASRSEKSASKLNCIYYMSLPTDLLCQMLQRVIIQAL